MRKKKGMVNRKDAWGVEGAEGIGDQELEAPAGAVEPLEPSVVGVPLEECEAEPEAVTRKAEKKAEEVVGVLGSCTPADVAFVYQCWNDEDGVRGVRDCPNSGCWGLVSAMRADPTVRRVFFDTMLRPMHKGLEQSQSYATDAEMEKKLKEIEALREECG